MKGYAMLEIGKTGWIDKIEPKCYENDAIIKPITLSPCSSDVHTVWAGALGNRHDMILGHECVGEIVEVGKNVRDFKVGDIVIVPAITPDWSSTEAQSGFAMHSHGMLSGWKFSNFKDGVFAEYFHVNDADGNLCLLPPNVSPIDATMLCDMVPTGFHGAELAEVTFGDSVCVIGIGPVGLMSVAACSLSGASKIYAVGSRPNCIEVAKEYGATDIVNYRDINIVDGIMELTHGKGVDKVIIAGGDNNTFIDAVKILKPGGAIGNVNYIGEGEYIKIPRVEWGCGMAHKTIKGGLMPGGRYRLEKLASLLESKKLDTSKLITHKFDNFENVEKALFLMKDKPKDLIKPVVKI